MPYVLPETQDVDFGAVADQRSAAPEQDSRQFAANYIGSLNRGTGGVLTNPGKWAVASLSDLGDTVASSIGLTERGDVNRKFMDAIGSPGFNAWFDENKGAVEVTSGIGGVLAADYLAGRILKPAGMAMKALQAVPFVKNVATLDSQYVAATRLVSLTQQAAAKRGLTGVARFTGPDMAIPYMGNLTVNSGRATRNFFGAGLKKGLARNVTTEALMAVGLNQNSMLYSDDLAHNVMWSAAGLGLGAGIDSMIGAYTLRKMANSDAIRQLNAKAFDPTGYESGRLQSVEMADSILAESGLTQKQSNIFFGGSGGVTDQVTSLAIQSAENTVQRGATEEARTLFGQRLRIATPLLNQAFEEMQKVTVRGLQGVAQSGFNVDKIGMGAAIKESLLRDPTSMFGISEVGTAVNDLGYIGTARLRETQLSRRQTDIAKLISDGGTFVTRKDKDGNKIQVLKPHTPEKMEALQEEAQRLLYARSHVTQIMLEPGEWAPLELGSLVDSYKPRNIITEGGLGSDNKAVWMVERDDGFKTRLGIGSDGEMYLPDGKARLEQLDSHEMIHMYHAMRKMRDHFVKTGMQFQVPAKPNWAQLDLAEQILKQNDGDVSKVMFPAGMTRETAMVEALAQKVDVLRKFEKQAQLAKSPLDQIDAYTQKIMLNLPRVDSYTAGLMMTHESPIELLLGGLKSGDQVRKMSHTDILKAMSDARSIQGFTDETGVKLSDLHGSSFDFLVDSKGDAIAPIIGARRPMAPYEWTRDDLFVRQAMKAGNVKATLLGEGADPYTAMLADKLTTDPSFLLSRKATELADDQHRSFVPGFRNAAPQTNEGALINAVTPRNRRDVDNMAMLAMSAQQDLKTRVMQDQVKSIIEGAMGDSITEITSARNARSHMLVNQFLSHRSGWVLKDKPAKIQLPSGEVGWTFVLDEKSVTNQRAFKQLYDRELTKDQQLLNPDGNPIAVDDLGLDVLNRMGAAFEAKRAAQNTALRSQGLPEIDRQHWYAPPPNIRGKYLAFTFDANRQVVPHMSIVADSPEQLAAMSRELMKSPLWKSDYVINSKDEVTSFLTLWDKAQMDWNVPNVTPLAGGKQGLGRLSGPQINENAFADAMTYLRDTLVQHSDDVLEILHDDVIKSLKTRAEMAKVETAVGVKNRAQHSSIYDRAIQNLTGQNALSAKDSFFGDGQAWLVKRIDGFLQGSIGRKPYEAAEKAARANRAMADWIRGADPKRPIKGQQFDRFAQELGQYMPYKNVAEMVERQTESVRPNDIAELTSKMSWFESSMRLRYLESAHALVNMGSILANMPSIIKSLQLRPGETVADMALRNSSIAMHVGLEDGKQIAIPNIPKLMWQASRDMLKHSGNNAIEAAKAEAFQLGHMNQEVAEFNAAWGAIDSKAGWRKVMFGDASHTGSKLQDKFIRNGGIDKVLGLLSDKSEQWTRQWGMQMGYRVAEAMGIDDPKLMNQLAKELTDKAIANYDPRNRPEIFQGPLGSLAGLFQSYAVNFYGRMFRYIETKDARALATQYATQSMGFGIGSTPGWNALNWAFFDRGQAEGDDPVESMYGRFGTRDADWIMHGTLSSLPKLFGIEGAALYTRGDSEVRLPGTEWKVQDLGFAQVPTPNLPVADTISRLANGFSMALSSFKADNDAVGVNQLAEIASNMITNRPIAGMIEQFGAGGNDTSMDGQLVARTKGFAEMAYRILGVRSMAQQKSIENFYADKTAREEQAARKSTLTSLTRAAIRDERFEDVPGLFQRYVAEGGDPRYYSKWLKSTFESSLDTRSERALVKALKDPNSQSNASIARLLDGQVDVDVDEAATEDYGREENIRKLAEQGWQGVPNPEAAEQPEVPFGMESEDPLETPAAEF